MQVWYLIVMLTGGDFSVMPFITEYACREAEANVPVEIVRESACQPVWLDWPGIDHPAPQSAPQPHRRPSNDV